MKPQITAIKVRFLDMVGFSMAFAVMALAAGLFYAFETHRV